MGIKKKKLTNDNNALAPIIWFLAIAGMTIAGLGVYEITQRPDITYNISDTGFSMAGVDVSWLILIAVATIIIFLYLWLGRGKTKTVYVQEPKNK